MPRLETRAVLAGAYRGARIEARTLLTHIALVLDDESISRTLCNRVEVDSLADSGATATDPKLATCTRCRRAHTAAKWPRHARRSDQ